MLKLALIEASHWHVPLYLPGLVGDNIRLVAISDREMATGRQIAERFSARLYEHTDNLLENEDIDFVFAFGRHCDLNSIGNSLLDRGLPFACEKPCGMNATEIVQLRDRALAQGNFVSIPLIMRFGELLPALERLNGPAPSRWRHLNFRFIAGPLQRYADNNCGWMLDKSLAGGGCTINLAVHFIDTLLKLTGEGVASVTAQMAFDPSLSDVEIFSTMTLTTDTGILCTIDTGYTYPGGTAERREFSFSLASDSHYVKSSATGMSVLSRDGNPPRELKIDLDTDNFYPVFARQSLNEFRTGVKSSPGLTEMARVMAVIDCAYASARQGGKPVMCRDDL